MLYDNLQSESKDSSISSATVYRDLFYILHNFSHLYHISINLPNSGKSKMAAHVDAFSVKCSRFRVQLSLKHAAPWCVLY
jgi:hypothetical protein